MSAPPQKIVLDPDVVRKALEASVRIPAYGSGALIPFRVNDEQSHIIDVLCKHPDALAKYPGARPGWQFFMKGRRIGATTVVCAYDVITTAMHDAAGYFYRTALIWQKEDKVKEQIDLCRRIAIDLGFPIVNDNTLSIEFPNGSYIEGLSAASKDAAARGSGFNRYHLSELPFWKHAKETWSSIQGAIEGDGAEVTIETTMALNNRLASDEWSRDNGYAKVFIAFEWHLQYRRDASNLSEEDEAYLRTEGFTIREAMAWAVDKCRNGYGGDWIEFFKDFPQLPHHPFQLQVGRWFLKVPRTSDPVLRTSVVGQSGVTWIVDWFMHPEDCSGSFVLGVDTGHGVGQDHSVVVAVDKVTRRIVACFAHNMCLRDDLARVAQHVRIQLSEPRFRRGHPIPSVLVETNGPGKYTYTELASLGETPTRVVTKNDDDDYQALVETKRAVEGGYCYGPARLFDEANGLHRVVSDDGNKLSGWRGPKDISMALGWCYLHIKKNASPSDVVGPFSQHSDVYRKEQARYKDGVRKRRRRGGI